MKVRRLVTDPQRVAHDRLIKLVREARKLEPMFQHASWEYLTDNLGHRGSRILHFRIPENLSEKVSKASPPMPTWIADWAKAQLAIRRHRDGLGLTSLTRQANAFRWLAVALQEAGVGAVHQVNTSHFDRAAKIVLEYCARNNGELTLQGLYSVAKFANTHRLTLTPINYVPPPGARGVDTFSQEARARERKLLPSVETFAALGRIRVRISSEYDQLMFCLLDVVFGTGARIGEVLAAGVNCIGRKTEYDPESGGKKIVPTFKSPIEKFGARIGKPLSTLQADVVLQAIARAKELSSKPRTAIRYFEKHAVVMPFPSSKTGLREEKSLADFNADYGLQPQLLRSIIRKEKLPTVRGPRTRSGGDGVSIMCRVSDIADIFGDWQRKEIENLSWQVTKGAQPLVSDWLFLEFSAFQGELIVKPIQYSRLIYWLTNEEYSVFMRHGEPDQRLTPHAMRRILHTAAKEGGIGDLELARYMGRKSVQSNAAYDYRTPTARAEEVRDAVRTGNAFGSVSRTYWNLPEIVSDRGISREEYVNTFVRSALRVPGGLCLHNHALEPCPFFIACLRGCGKFLVIRGDSQIESGLVEQIESMTAQLDGANVPWRDHPKPELLGPWVNNLVQQIKFAEESLAQVRSPGERTAISVRPDAEAFDEQDS